MKDNKARGRMKRGATNQKNIEYRIPPGREISNVEGEIEVR